MMGSAPLKFTVVEQALRDSPDIEVIDRVGPKNIIGALAAGVPGGAGVLVARMAEEKAAALAMQSQGQLIVERDQSLQLLDVNYPQSELMNYSLPMTGTALTAAFLVMAQDKPIEGADVYPLGRLLHAHRVTDAKGTGRLPPFGQTTSSGSPFVFNPPLCDRTL